MSLFIEYPLLALVPALLLLFGARASRRRLPLAAAILWTGYALYEYGMRRRWLCSGECNIRVDLLLIYPVLVLLSAAAAGAVVAGVRRHRATS